MGIKLLLNNKKLPKNSKKSHKLMEYYLILRKSKCMIQVKCNLMEIKAQDLVVCMSIPTIYLECSLEEAWEDFQWVAAEGEVSHFHLDLADYPLMIYNLYIIVSNIKNFCLQLLLYCGLL